MFLSAVPRPSVPEYVLHQMLWGYFPGIEAGCHRPFVFRVEHDHILMLSRVRPSVPASHIGDRLTAGRSYQFRVLVSPMNTYQVAGKSYGRRVIEGNEKRRAWLSRRIAGAEIRFSQIYDRPELRFARPGGERVWVVRCEAVGVLHVTDRGAFADNLLRGIGGRGCWGCGLMVLPEIMGEVLRESADHRTTA